MLVMALVFRSLLGLAGVLLTVTLAVANPFGPVVPSEPVPGFGFDALVRWTASAQSYFYEGLTGALREVGVSWLALWGLLGLSFSYGVVHAAGPGHGKVVIASYMVASGETARRGAFLAIGAALVQATGAVVLVGLFAGVFGVSRAFLTDATITLERVSYALIIAMGLYLVVRSLRRWLPLLQPAPPMVAATGPSGHAHGTLHHGHDEECGCDHVHMPDAAQVSQSTSLGQSFGIVLAAGARPCTGALLVLVLALSQDLLWAGALSAYAMGVGTAITVGLMAVFAGSLSTLFARGGDEQIALNWLWRTFSLAGGFAVIAFGVLLLSASLAR